jgi:hypothetical protein
MTPQEVGVHTQIPPFQPSPPIKTNSLPQNTTNTSPPQHKPTQSLTQHTPTKPNIPPSTPPQNIPTTLPALIHAHHAALHTNTTLDLAATAAREERAGAGAGGAL